MPELVRTSLLVLLPDSLSATIDSSSLSLDYFPQKLTQIQIDLGQEVHFSPLSLHISTHYGKKKTEFNEEL